ncbi:MAG: undecaprenyl-diphosphate phosphatase [Phycisphaerales bacterium]|nr:undecaprenyl-diphosphate phosphatase [Phycisphaerales bacterium]MCB9837057.1 undecaprenyl-diphosphate phosphatase [Phycisphaera sp.]
MEWWQAAILGLVEGITEYLPISSTGHLIIASSLMGLDQPESKHAVDAFNIVIQGGAILAVLGLYRQRVAQMIAGVLGKNPEGLRLAIRLFVAFLPAAVLGVLLNDLIESYLFRAGPVLAALFLGGVYMIAIDRRRMRRHRREETPETEGSGIDTMSLRSAIIIGLMQCIAMCPGTSRSMMTITGGVLTGLKPKEAAEFSFLLGLPTLGGACVWKLISNLRETSASGTPNIFETFGIGTMVIGIGVATVSAIVAVRWLVGFLNKHGLEAFGWYRIALAILLGSLIWAGVVTLDHTGTATTHSAAD